MNAKYKKHYVKDVNKALRQDILTIQQLYFNRDERFAKINYEKDDYFVHHVDSIIELNLLKFENTKIAVEYVGFPMWKNEVSIKTFCSVDIKGETPVYVHMIYDALVKI